MDMGDSNYIVKGWFLFNNWLGFVGFPTKRDGNCPEQGSTVKTKTGVCISHKFSHCL
jgi:hypothetical protein